VTTPPWRVQDIPDALLGRSSRPSLPAEGLPGGDEEVDLDGEWDEVYLMLLPVGDGGRVQPVFWGMNFHTHGQDCARA
jgi:hypothetical protein